MKGCKIAVLWQYFPDRRDCTFCVVAIKVCQLHLYRTADLHICYQFSDLHLCYYLCKIKYSYAASYMIVKITQNIALQGNMSCSILRSLYSYQLHHTAYYYMFKHVIAFLVNFTIVLTKSIHQLATSLSSILHITVLSVSS